MLGHFLKSEDILRQTTMSKYSQQSGLTFYEGVYGRMGVKKGVKKERKNKGIYLECGLCASPVSLVEQIRD